MQAEATHSSPAGLFGSTTIESPSARARQKLRIAIADALDRLGRETSDIDFPERSATASELLDALVQCADGVRLDLRRLGNLGAHRGYAEPSCLPLLVIKRLPASAWRDLQSACETRFTEVALPDALGSDAALSGLRGLRGLRSVSMRLDADARTVDLRTLADFVQPVHVEIRCPARIDLEVLAPENVTVSAAVEGGAHHAVCSAIPSGESAIAFFDRAVRIAAQEGVRFRLSWSGCRSAASSSAATRGRLSWLRRTWAYLRSAAAAAPAEKPVAMIRDECFSVLEDALAQASKSATGFAPRYHIRSQALHVFDCLQERTLALETCATVGPLVLSMRQEGWLALDRYCRARSGRGIQRIQFPAQLASLRYNKVFLANLDLLRDLSVVQFGAMTTSLPPRAA